MCSSFSQEVQNFPQCNITAPWRVSISGWLAATPVLKSKWDIERRLGEVKAGELKRKGGAERRSKLWVTDSCILCPQRQTGIPCREEAAIRGKTYSTQQYTHTHTVSLSQCHRQKIHSTRFDATQNYTVSSQTRTETKTDVLLMANLIVLAHFTDVDIPYSQMHTETHSGS